MKKLNLLVLSLVIACLLAYLNLLAYEYYWYWRLWWFDIIMHFFGGIMLGALGLYIFGHKDISTDRLSFFVYVKRALIMALFIGLLWEFFEFGLDHLVVQGITLRTAETLQQGLPDTIGDLTFDAIGAISVATLYYLTKTWRQRKQA